MPFSEVSFPKVVKHFLKLHFIHLLYWGGKPRNAMQHLWRSEGTVVSRKRSYLWVSSTLPTCGCWGPNSAITLVASTRSQRGILIMHFLVAVFLSPFPTPASISGFRLRIYYQCPILRPGFWELLIKTNQTPVKDASKPCPFILFSF